MSSEEVEHEFSKRSRALQDFNEKYNFGMNNNKNCLRPPFTSAGNGDDVDDTVIAVAVAVADGVVYVVSPSQTYTLTL